jgi:hypothetical protein
MTTIATDAVKQGSANRYAINHTTNIYRCNGAYTTAAITAVNTSPSTCCDTTVASFFTPSTIASIASIASIAPAAIVHNSAKDVSRFNTTLATATVASVSTTAATESPTVANVSINAEIAAIPSKPVVERA